MGITAGLVDDEGIGVVFLVSCRILGVTACDGCELLSGKAEGCCRSPSEGIFD